MLTGIASFVILVAGMGLVARLKTGFPPWVIGKLVVWLIVTAIGHVVAKRFPGHGVLAYWISIGLAFTAVYLAVMKPGIGA